MSTTASSPPGDNEPTDDAAGFSLLSAVRRGLKVASVAASVWLWGHFGFSIAWVYVGLFFHVASEECRKIKDAKKAYAKQAINCEKEAILSRVDHQPSWVYFPTVEKAEWFNKILTQMWPYIGEYTQELLTTTVQEKIQGSLPSSFNNFSFATIDLGDTPPRVDSMVVYTDRMKKDEIVCDAEFRYAGDAEIKINVNGVKAGIKKVHMNGTMRVIMRPLVDRVPLVGGLSVFFLSKPRVDFDLTDAANVLDAPLLGKSLRGIIQDQIANYLVLPNRIPIQLAADIDITMLKHPVPEGVIHLEIVEARELKVADTFLGRGSSDPYCTIEVGAKTFKTRVVKNSLAPEWNQHFEIIIDQKYGQCIDMEIRDEDVRSDDSLGTASFSVETIAKSGTIDSRKPLEGVDTGAIHVKATWLYLCKDIEKMRETRKEIKAGDQSLSCAVLILLLQEASNVPGEQNVFARLKVNGQSHDSTVKQKTSDPQWDENFQFLIGDPETQQLTVELYHRGSSEKRLGAVGIPINMLLSVDDLSMTKKFQLSDIGPTCTLSARLTLRMLTRDMPFDWIYESQAMSEALLGTTVPQSKPEVGDSTVTSTQDKVSHDKAGGASGDARTVTPDVKAGQSSRRVTTQPDIVPVKQQPVQSSRPSELGQIQLMVQFSTDRKELLLSVNQCRGLIPCDKDNLADPYVRIYVLPDRSKSSKRKTRVAKNTLTPTFNETFEWEMTESEVGSTSLEVVVKNEVGLFSSSREIMGQVIVCLSDLGDISRPVTAWYNLGEVESS